MCPVLEVLLLYYLVLPVQSNFQSPCSDVTVSNLRADNVTATSIRLSWTPPPLIAGRRCYKDVEVSYGHHKQNENCKQCTNWTTDHNWIMNGVTLGDIEPCTAYDISVRVIDRGVRLSETNITVHTRPDVKADNLTVAAVTENSVAVTWNVVETKCKPWKAFFRLVSVADKTTETRLVPAYSDKIEFTNLTPCTTYDVSLALLSRSLELTTDNSELKPSEGTDLTTLYTHTAGRVGDIVVTNLTATSFTISWDPLPVCSRAKTKYQVKLRTSKLHLKNETWNQKETFKIFVNMEPCTEFNFTVKVLYANEKDWPVKDQKKVNVHTLPNSFNGTIRLLGTDLSNIKELCHQAALPDVITTHSLVVIILSACVSVLVALMVVLKCQGLKIRGQRWKIDKTREPPLVKNVRKEVPEVKQYYTKDPLCNTIDFQGSKTYDEVYDAFYPDHVYSCPYRF